MNDHSLRRTMAADARGSASVVRATRIASIALIALSLILPAVPAQAVARAATIRVQGTILVLDGVRLPVGSTQTVPAPGQVRLVTASGESVEIVGAIPESVATGSTFAGVVAIPISAHDLVTAELKEISSAATLDPNTTTPLDGNSSAASDVLRAVADLKVQLTVASGTVTPPTTSRTSENDRRSTGATSSQGSNAGQSGQTPPTAQGLSANLHTLNVAIVNLPSAATDVVATDDQVAHLTTTVSDFWSSQSAGKVAGITRSGSIQRFTSTNACSPTDSWDEAAAKFNRTSSSYWAAPSNTHLVVIAPRSCASNYTGMASLGNSLDGGLVWLSYIPSIIDIDIAHEVGHNLSMRHANVSNCSGSSSDGSGCADDEYLDYYDVMGAALTVNGSGNPQLPALNVNQRDQLGALSSSDLTAIRLPSNAKSTEADYSFGPASNTSGPRGLKVTDPSTNTVYYVEYRNGSGSDTKALYTTGFSPNYDRGVRVLTLRSDLSSAVLTVPVANSSDRHLFLTPGQSLSLGSGALTIKVVSTGNIATVHITLGSMAKAGSAITAGTPTISGQPVFGNTLTSTPGTWSPANTSLSYQWFGNGVAIGGANGANYTLLSADIGHAMTVVVTGTSNGSAPTSGTSAPTAVVTTPGSNAVYRFWSSTFSSHFYTISAAERDRVIAQYPGIWSYEGPVYNAFASQAPGTVALYRFWSDSLRGHFYTADPAEKDRVIAQWPDVWHYEQVAYYVYPESFAQKNTAEVTRFWSPVYRHHFYTANPAERDHVVNTWPTQWNLEGPRFRVPSF